IVEFLDPECEACRAMHPIVKQLTTEYAGKVRWIPRYVPLHGNSKFAIAVLEEARQQGKFEEALDAMFEHQHDWGSHDNPKPELIVGYMKDLGVDPKTLSRDAVIEKHKAIIERDQADGQAVMIQGTPTFFVNGRRVFDLGYEPLKKAIDSALAAN
ncbi:MAG TPA: thioredoxin domain-containing protein, partial [Bdellovibrionales bacterium]|nr:thioredoxin domain-containing protein [Bdellovibrionales bacterium]